VAGGAVVVVDASVAGGTVVAGAAVVADAADGWSDWPPQPAPASASASISQHQVDEDASHGSPRLKTPSNEARTGRSIALLLLQPIADCKRKR
jgi:hypothetical protein